MFDIWPLPIVFYRDKQRRPRCDAAFGGVSSGSSLFVSVPFSIICINGFTLLPQVPTFITMC